MSKVKGSTASARDTVERRIVMGLGDAVLRLIHVEAMYSQGVDPGAFLVSERDLIVEALNQQFRLDLGMDCDQDGIPDQIDDVVEINTVEIFKESAATSCCRILPEGIKEKTRTVTSSSRKPKPKPAVEEALKVEEAPEPKAKPKAKAKPKPKPKPKAKPLKVETPPKVETPKEKPKPEKPKARGERKPRGASKDFLSSRGKKSRGWSNPFKKDDK